MPSFTTLLFVPLIYLFVQAVAVMLRPPELRIIGGHEVTNRNSYGFMVALKDIYYEEPSKPSKPFCGGTLISNEWVVTAAHCVYGPSSKFLRKWLRISINRHNISSLPSEEDGLDLEISQVFIHPKYDDEIHYHDPADYDVALIKLRNMTRDGKTIVILDNETGFYSASGQDATTLGWGSVFNENITGSDILREVTIPLISTEECRQYYNDLITDRMICAGYPEGGKDSCKGDSGGPLFTYDANRQPVLVGIVSWGEGCGLKGFPGVYTKISSVERWIRATINLYST